jgi:hypothetical protein
MVTFLQRRAIFSMLCALMLAACNTTPKNDTPRTPIKSIAIIPASNTPLGFEYSASFFVPPIARGIINRVNAGLGEVNAKIINDKLAAQGYDIGKQLTEGVVKQLQDAGFSVEVLTNIERKPGAPDDVDYTKIAHNSDAIFHVFFSEVTYQTPRGQSAFWPRVSASVQVYDKTGKNYLFETETYLDRGAKESRPGYFDAKDDLSFQDQEVMLTQIDKIRANLEGFTTRAAQYLGKSAAEQSR